MDPLSISMGVAGVLPLIAQVITTAREYVNSVANAREMIRSLILELEVLKSAIEKLGDLLLTDKIAESDIQFDQASVLLSCSTAIEVKLQELFKRLARESNRKLGSLLWPFTEKEHQKTIGELKNFTTWIHFALSIDGCRLLSQTSDHVVAVLAGQLEQFKATQKLDSKTTELFSAVQKQNKALEDSASLDHRRRVLDWISTTKHDIRHAILQRSRTQNTGSWLLRSDSFMEWRAGRSQANILWCNGIQGSGKTVLACTAIDELKSRIEKPDTLLAYYYFDYQDHKSHAPLNVVSSLLRQLLEQLPELPAPVEELYEARIKSDGNQLLEYERLLQVICQTEGATYLVFDALDECGDLKYVLDLLKKLGQLENCRILVTSRPHVCRQLPPSFPCFELEIKAQDEDIKRYILEQCDAANIHQVADDYFIHQLVEKLTQSASGMFLLPVLQLRTVLNEPTIGEMQDKLDQLTEALSDAFAETMARIQRLPGSRSRLALSALMHLAHAQRLFQASELCDILALRPEKSFLDTKYRPRAKMILDCCQGLAVLDEETGQIRLAHYAIQEYLVSNSEQLFPKFAVRLAFDCLDYLLLDDFKEGPLEADVEIEKRLASYPFLAYTSLFWGSYVKPVETSPEVRDKLLTFYESSPATAVTIQVVHFEAGYHTGYYCPKECLSTTPLHHSAVKGLVHSTRILLDSYDINRGTAMGTTPLIKATSSGHPEVVKLLLEQGADPRRRNWYGNALLCAAEAGKCETIRQLVEWGMDPNEECEDGRTPLGAALDNDSAQAVELLVDLGADLGLREGGEVRKNRFLEACAHGCNKTVDMILRRGWVDLGSGDLTVLALRVARLPIIRHLINSGANVNAVDKDGRTALWHARNIKDFAVAQVLQEAGARLQAEETKPELNTQSLGLPRGSSLPSTVEIESSAST
ncbi:hypothetical protein NLU13_5537 [Sarocladium strictum]|uniref:NACHT domain-containing protein n=1 Tax=Sarocladium strictum TaxID=5046 RepID=A0AA39GHU1_SARSR|nr:hypothetical protein NLU13_5537 [Sarocladium strictum]